MEWLLQNLPFVYGLALGIVIAIVNTTAVVVTVRQQLTSLKQSSAANGVELKGVNTRLDDISRHWVDEMKELRAEYEADIEALRRDFGTQISAVQGLANMARAELASFQVEAANMYAKQEYMSAMETRMTEHFDAAINRLLQVLSLAIGQLPQKPPS